MPVGEPAPVCSRFGTTPGSFRCQCRCGISVSRLAQGSLPAGAGEFILVAVVAIFHDKVDADASIAVVIVVGLPDGAEAVDAEFPVVAEVPAQRFDSTAIQFAAEGHTFLVRFASGSNFVAGEIDDDFSVRRVQLFTAVAEVEVQSAIRSEGEAVDTVVVLRALDSGEHDFASIGPQVSVIVIETEHAVTGRDNDSVAEDADTVCRIDVTSLMEDSLSICFTVVIGVFEYEDAVAFRAVGVIAIGKSAVVDNFADPDASEMVNVDIGRAEQHGFGGEELDVEFFCDVESGDCSVGSSIDSGSVGDGARCFRVDEELDTAAITLI